MTFHAALILVVLLAFAAMGLIAIVAPLRVVEQFDIKALTAVGRNEVRAVYGGFGLAMSSVLAVALIASPLKAGICFAVGAALAGMALGRVVSAISDRFIGKFSLIYFFVEAIGGLVLFYSSGWLG